MDKRILGSIITILILLSVLWVFAVAGNEISSDSFIKSNATASGNYSTTYEWAGTNAPWCNVTLNMTLMLDFDMGPASAYTYNISNISIRVPEGYEGLYELGFSADTNCSVNNSGGLAGGLDCVRFDFGCSVNGNDVIECINSTAELNISGNATVFIWFEAFANWTAYGAIDDEGLKDWRVTVATNKTASTVAGTANVQFGVDDLRPRISSINVTTGAYTLVGKEGDFNNSNINHLLNATNINVTIVVNEYNREDIYMFWGTWNGSVSADVGASNVGTNWSLVMGTGLDSEAINMTKNTGCKSPERGGSTQASCWYSVEITNTGGENFSDGETYTLMFWTNDSFNHEANFTNSNSGYNFTIDGDNPTGTLTMPKITRVFSGRSITFKCETNDVDGHASLGKITITSPRDKEITKTVDNINREATFSGMNELAGTGLYKVKCKATDQVGRTWTSAEEEFRVMARGGVAGVAPEAPVADVDISSTETPSGDISGIEGESETFTIDGVTAHRLNFIEVGLDYAKISIESTPVEFTLNIGESKEVDLDGKIVKVTLSSIVNGKASVSITNIEKYEEKLEEERKVREGVEAKGYGLWITLLVIVALIVIGYFVLKSRKSKKGEVHFTRQDLGL